ncbi:MAG: helix-turn-helix domain-containing protein, partial [Planctomycetia bacterium]|nr:helix-turn-helix domain-containing protein [Planctomycetia bacterium]
RVLHSAQQVERLMNPGFLPFEVGDRWRWQFPPSWSSDTRESVNDALLAVAGAFDEFLKLCEWTGLCDDESFTTPDGWCLPPFLVRRLEAAYRQLSELPLAPAPPASADSPPSKPKQAKPKKAKLKRTKPACKQGEDTWPPKEGWAFQPGRFAYYGKVFALTGIPMKLLQRFVRAGDVALAVEQLEDDIWGGTRVSEETVRSAISVLRGKLRKLLKLKANFDPIECVDRKAYQLRLF